MNFKILGVLTFAFTLLSGLVQFGSISFLSQVLDAANFSQVSIVFSNFTAFFLIVECGIQAEVVRRLSCDQSGKDFSVVLYLRLALAALTVFIAISYCYITGVSSFLAWSFFFYSLSYFPFAVLFCVEELGYAKRSLIMTMAYRFARLLGMLSFIAFVAYSLGRTDADTSIKSAQLFLLFPLIHTVIAIPALKFLFNKGLLRRVSLRELSEFIRSSLNLFLSTIFRTVDGYFYSALLVSTFGESNLSAFNIAFALMAPLSMMNQVLGNIISSKFGHQEVNLNKDFRVISILSLVLSSIYTVIFSQDFILSFVFGQLDHKLFLRLFVPLVVAQYFSSLISVLSAGFLDRGYSRGISIGYGAKLVGLVASCLIMNHELFALYYTVPFGLSFLCLLVTLYVLARKEKILV